jgi:hypothetical protein
MFVLKLAQRTRAAGDPNELSEAVWSTEWFEEFSSFRYLPMRRLLSEEDEEFYVKSVGGNSSARSAFRADRRRLFYEYLSMIQADFSRLSQGLRLSIVHANEDRSEQINSLLRLEWSFRTLLLQARFRASLHWVGVRPMDASELINALQGFEFGLRELRVHPGS